MKEHRHLYRSFFPLTCLLTIALWFYFFPVGSTFDWKEICFEATYLAAFIIGYFFVLRARIRLLEIGWALLTYGSLIDFLDEFTGRRHLGEGDVQLLLQTLGVLVIAIGVYFSLKIIRSELAKAKRTEEALRSSEELYRAMVTSMAEGLVLQDNSGAIHTANPSAERILGLSGDEMTGRTPLDPRWQAIHLDGSHFPGEAHPAMVSLQTGEPCSNVIMGLNRSDGTLVWISINSQPLFNPGDDKPYAVVVSFSDITDLKLIENSLTYSEEQYRNLFENIPIGVYRTTSDGRFVMANPALIRMLGYSSFEELSTRDLNANPHRSEFKELIEREDEITGWETTCTRVDNCPIFLRENSRAIRGKDGIILYYEGTVEDITERKRVDRELARLASFPEQNPNPVIEIHLGGEVTYVNSAAKTAFPDLSKVGLQHPILKGFRSGISTFERGEAASLSCVVDLGEAAYEQKIWYRSEDKLARIYMTDITERKRAEENLEQKLGLLSKKNRYESIIGTVTRSVHQSINLQDVLENAVKSMSMNIDNVDYLGIFMVEGQEAILKANIGYPEEFIGRVQRIPYPKGFTWKTIIDGKLRYVADVDLDTVIGPTGRDAGTKSYASMPIRYEGKTVGCININSFKKNAFDEEDLKLLEIVARQIEAAINNARQADLLRESEERYRTLNVNIYDLVCEIASDARYLYLSPNHKEVLGYEPNELMHSSILGLVHPDDLSSVKTEVEKCFRAGSGRASFRYRHKNGEWRWFESLGKVFLTANGETRGVIVSRDITERKKMEEELIKAQKLESLGVLAGGIAHDFNNLLTAILGNISLSKTRLNPDENSFKRLSDAEKACFRAKDLTQQLLTFSRGGTPVRKPVSVVELIKDAAAFSLMGSNVKCEFSIAEDLWAVNVDEGQISQAINNLVINAQQAMPDGGSIKLSARNLSVVGTDTSSPKLSEGKYVMLTVEDRGMGIPEEHISKIFDPYFTTKQKGNGLGLSIVHSIVKNHDGRVEVESEPRRGTKINIYLPASDGPVSPRKPDEADSSAGRGRVLVMDDEETVREILGDILSFIGYEVEFATDGKEAIEIYKNNNVRGNPIDVVIMDLTIPGGMGGKDTIDKLLSIDPEVRAIVSSGYSNDPVLSEHQKYGFKGVVKKPYSIEELTKTLNEVIKEK